MLSTAESHHTHPALRGEPHRPRTEASGTRATARGASPCEQRPPRLAAKARAPPSAHGGVTERSKAAAQGAHPRARFIAASAHWGQGGRAPPLLPETLGRRCALSESHARGGEKVGGDGGAPERSYTWPGLMDKASVFGTKDCRLESCQGHACAFVGPAACPRHAARCHLGPRRPPAPPHLPITFAI